MVECRDRKKRQGSDWIEQIASKRDDVGASKAVAVCPGGFTRGAAKLAAAEQIELRTMATVSSPEVFSWLRLQTIRYRSWSTDFRVIRPGIEHGRLEFDPKQAQALGSDRSHKVPLFVRRADGTALTVEDMWNMVDKDATFA